MNPIPHSGKSEPFHPARAELGDIVLSCVVLDGFIANCFGTQNGCFTQGLNDESDTVWTNGFGPVSLPVSPNSWV